MNQRWEDYVAARFPAYLLPASQRESISAEEAQRFLAHFAGSAADLRLVTLASLFCDPEKRAVLESLAHRTAPHLCRNLPSTAVVETRLWDGAYRGRLDVTGTLTYHASGQPTRFVTRDRRRTYDLPQTALVRSTLERLHEAVRALREHGVTRRENWGGPLLDAEPALRELLVRTPLQHLPGEPIGSVHVHASKRARHPAYADALRWHLWFEEANGSMAERARHLARGALFPLSLDARFEVAVLLSLIEAVRERLAGPEWGFECSAIASGRSEVARLANRSGAAIEFLYNQPRFPTRARDQLLARYMGSLGRMRPDITVVFTRPNAPARCIAIEVKRSNDEGYLRLGLEEALFYRYEFDAHLVEGKPKSILVSEGALPGAAEDGDEVIAVGWPHWPPVFVIDGLVAAAA